MGEQIVAAEQQAAAVEPVVLAAAQPDVVAPGGERVVAARCVAYEDEAPGQLGHLPVGRSCRLGAHVQALESRAAVALELSYCAGAAVQPMSGLQPGGL